MPLPARMCFVAACSLLVLCSCSRQDKSEELTRLQSELDVARADAAAARADAAAARAESAKLKAAIRVEAVKPKVAVKPDAPPVGGKKVPEPIAEKADKRSGSGEMTFSNGKTRRFTKLDGVQGTQGPQLAWTYQKVPGELYFSTVDRRQLFLPIDKLASIKITDTGNNSNPEAEVVPGMGEKQIFRYWILSSLMDVNWEGALGAERLHLHGGLTITFDK